MSWQWWVLIFSAMSARLLWPWTLDFRRSPPTPPAPLRCTFITQLAFLGHPLRCKLSTSSVGTRMRYTTKYRRLIKQIPSLRSNAPLVPCVVHILRAEEVASPRHEMYGLLFYLIICSPVPSRCRLRAPSVLLVVTTPSPMTKGARRPASSRWHHISEPTYLDEAGTQPSVRLTYPQSRNKASKRRWPSPAKEIHGSGLGFVGYKHVTELLLHDCNTGYIVQPLTPTIFNSALPREYSFHCW